VREAEGEDSANRYKFNSRRIFIVVNESPVEARENA
jgi:hypothetical protein